MSDSGGRFKFLKKFSSKVDKLFLGDMIQSNSSDYNSSKNSLEFEDYNQDFRENNQEFEDYNSGFRENNQKFIESNPDKVENYSNNSFENRFEYSSKNNVNNDSNINSNYINHNFNNNFEDKYSDYIYVDEFDDFNRNSNFQDKFGNNFQDLRGGFQDDLMHGGNYYDDNYYNNDLGKKNSKIKDFSFSLKNLKNKLLNFNNSSKKNFGLIAISLIILVLGASVFYFGIYQPFQNELDTEKTAKLNELNTLYKGPLALNSHVYTLENQIKDSYDVNGVKSIDVLRIATEDWRAYHGSKINAFEDAYGRIMMSYCENNSEKVLMPTVDAKLFVNENDAKILSNIAFEKVDTVIVPIYKVEKYLKKCLDSIINQTYNNLEIILVDDGSPDNCPALCDEYAQKDSRIRVIHKQNGGLSSARNAGFEIATSEYISFVDSDDYLNQNMYEKMMKIVEDYHPDIERLPTRYLQDNFLYHNT